MKSWRNRVCLTEFDTCVLLGMDGGICVVERPNAFPASKAFTNFISQHFSLLHPPCRACTPMVPPPIIFSPSNDTSHCPVKDSVQAAEKGWSGQAQPAFIYTYYGGIISSPTKHAIAMPCHAMPCPKPKQNRAFFLLRRQKTLHRLGGGGGGGGTSYRPIQFDTI